ncbi:hypothetical protein D1007_25575 [Hordeum vulgare]|nr:hypothetical protein D1007_25575 [Hordeum vulgare]
MELLLLPSRATVSRRLLPTAPVCRASAATFRPAASPSNVEATTDATATTSVAKTGQEWGAGGRQGQMSFRLGPDLSEEMRRGMMWRMLAFPAAAVAAEAALLWVLDSGGVGRAVRGKAARVPVGVLLLKVGRRRDGVHGGVGARPPALERAIHGQGFVHGRTR